MKEGVRSNLRFQIGRPQSILSDPRSGQLSRRGMTPPSVSGGNLYRISNTRPFNVRGCGEKIRGKREC